MKRIIISTICFIVCFSSSVKRIQQTVDLNSGQPLIPEQAQVATVPTETIASAKEQRVEYPAEEKDAAPAQSRAEQPQRETEATQVTEAVQHNGNQPVNAVTAEQPLETTSPAETIPAQTRPVDEQKPVETAPAATEWVAETQAPATEPQQETQPATEPMATESTAEPEPAGCFHQWQVISHEAEGHAEMVNTCACGYQFGSIGEYDAHLNDYAGTAEMITVHGHWSSFEIWVIDSPAWSETRCTICGATP